MSGMGLRGYDVFCTYAVPSSYDTDHPLVKSQHPREGAKRTANILIYAVAKAKFGYFSKYSRFAHKPIIPESEGIIHRTIATITISGLVVHLWNAKTSGK